MANFAPRSRFERMKHATVQWSWDDDVERNFRVRVAECLGTGWSFPMNLQAAAKSLKRRARKTCCRRVRVRIGGTDVAFAGAAEAAEVLLQWASPRHDAVEESDDENCKGSDDAPTCAVCLDALFDACSVWQLPCGHRFHSRCMYQWFLRKGSCPMCRKELFGETIQHRSGRSSCKGSSCLSNVSTALISGVPSCVL